MNSRTCRDILHRHALPLAPRPTGIEPVLRQLSGIRAVLFDVYGTLVISACGEVGTDSSSAGAAEEAFAAAGGQTPLPGDEIVRRLHEAIRASHEKSRREGIEYPEVDIVAVWRHLLDALELGGHLDAERLAVEYEVRVNPTWPMPGLGPILERLSARRLLLGIVSNAQFYTTELFPALTGATLEDLGFQPDLVYTSHRAGHAKPGRRLYELAAAGLAVRGIRTSEALYVGNDRLNDVMPANALGFRTALYAGDARSYRPRDDDPRLEGVAPDLVLIDLDSIDSCLVAA